MIRCRAFLVAAFLPYLFVSAADPVQIKVKCMEDHMQVEMRRTDDMGAIYLKGLKNFPDPVCQPLLVGHEAIFRLPLSDDRCGVTKIVHQPTGKETYYYLITVETDDAKESHKVKCHSTNHTIQKRNVLPAGFQEPVDLEITTSLTERAPQPELQVGVRQAGQLVSGELNVNPGTPLQMEIYLDKVSAPIYGLLVSYMQVSDTKAQEETIIFNGCSVDPYLFENFNTVNGDFLTAKFRAFKFPDSTYVQFKGTVNVCLDKCRGVDCSNGRTGYGKKKREIPAMPPDPNKVFEVSITSFIKVEDKGEHLLDKVKLDLGPEPIESVIGNETISVQEISSDQKQQLKLTEQKVEEDLIYKFIEETSSGLMQAGNLVLILGSIVFIRFH